MNKESKKQEESLLKPELFTKHHTNATNERKSVYDLNSYKVGSAQLSDFPS